MRGKAANFFKKKDGSALIIVLVLLLVVMGYCAVMSTFIHSSTQSNLTLQENQQAYLVAKSGLEYAVKFLDGKLDEDGYGVDYVKKFADANPCTGEITLNDTSLGLSTDELVGKFTISFDNGLRKGGLPVKSEFAGDPSVVATLPEDHFKVISTGEYNGHEVQVFKIYNVKTFKPPLFRLTTGGENDVELHGGATGDVLLKGPSVYKFNCVGGGVEFQNLVSKGGFHFVAGGAAEVQGGVYGLNWIINGSNFSLNGKGMYSCKGIYSTAPFLCDGNLVVDGRMYTEPGYVDKWGVTHSNSESEVDAAAYYKDPPTVEEVLGSSAEYTAYKNYRDYSSDKPNEGSKPTPPSSDFWGTAAMKECDEKGEPYPSWLADAYNSFMASYAAQMAEYNNQMAAYNAKAAAYQAKCDELYEAVLNKYAEFLLTYTPEKICDVGDIYMSQATFENTDSTRKVIAATGNISLMTITGTAYLDVYSLKNVTIENAQNQYINIHALGDVNLGGSGNTLLNSTIVCKGNLSITNSNIKNGTIRVGGDIKILGGKIENSNVKCENNFIVLDKWIDLVNCNIGVRGVFDANERTKCPGSTVGADGGIINQLSWGTIANTGSSGITGTLVDADELRAEIEKHIAVINDEESSLGYETGNTMTIEEYIYNADVSVYIGDTKLPDSVSGDSTPVIDLSSLEIRDDVPYNTYSYSGGKITENPGVARVKTINESCILKGTWAQSDGKMSVLYIDASSAKGNCLDIRIDSAVSIPTNAELCINDAGGSKTVRIFLNGQKASLRLGNMGYGHVYRVKDDTLAHEVEKNDDNGESILNPSIIGAGTTIKDGKAFQTVKDGDAVADLNLDGKLGGIPELYIFGCQKEGEILDGSSPAGGNLYIGAKGGQMVFRGYIISKITDVTLAYENIPAVCGMVYCRNLKNDVSNTSTAVECHAPTVRKYTRAVSDIWEEDE